jgi:hypothetical protein
MVRFDPISAVKPGNPAARPKKPAVHTHDIEQRPLPADVRDAKHFITEAPRHHDRHTHPGGYDRVQPMLTVK